LAKKYEKDRKDLEYVFTDSINSKEMSSKIKSYVLKQAQGNNEFEQKKDKVNLQKRYDDVLEKKFIYKFTSALPKYDFNAKQYNLSGKWGGFFPICSESHPDIEFPPIKINANNPHIFMLNLVQNLQNIHYPLQPLRLGPIQRLVELKRLLDLQLQLNLLL